MVSLVAGGSQKSANAVMEFRFGWLIVMERVAKGMMQRFRRRAAMPAGFSGVATGGRSSG
jgi:hypothetical protein